jgi:hypothetical protein
MYLALTHTNKTAQQNASTVTLLRLIFPFLRMLLCHLSSGMKPLYLLPFSSIASPLLFLIIAPLWRNCFKLNRPIPSFVPLVACVGHTYAHTTHISLLFDPNSVYSLVTAPTTKATSALISLLAMCISLAMSSLMSPCFLSPNFTLMPLFVSDKKFLFYMIPCFLRHLGVIPWSLITCLSLLMLLYSHVLHRSQVLQPQCWIGAFCNCEIPIIY